MRASLALLAALGTSFASCATAERAEPAPGKAWDQAAVTTLARELAGVAGDLRQSVRRQPGIRADGIRRARHRALDDLRVAERSIWHLLRQLENGSGQLETYPTFRRIQTVSRDVARNVRRAALTEPTTSKLEAAREVLVRLEPFYAAEAAAYEAGGDV